MTIKELFAPSDMTVGKPLGEDCNFYNPHADRQYRSAALQHRRQYCHRKIRGRQRPGGSRKRQPRS